MKYYAGLDVSLENTAICVIDQEGRIINEGSALTEPEAIVNYLSGVGVTFHRIGLETGNMTGWLCEGLIQAGLPVICIEARHAHTMLKAHPVKTDRNDARGLARIMCAGWYKAVHIKTRQSQSLRVLLNNRNTLLAKKKDIDNQRPCPL